MKASDTKTKITFMMPECLHFDYRAQMVNDGYDMRAKSRWIMESITQLLHMNNYPELVYLSMELQGTAKPESLVITTAQKLSLEHAIISVRKAYPAIEGVQSRLVRTSILQRLLKS